MAALVVEDQLADVGEVLALEVPAVERKREAVHEDDGQRRGVVTIDLDVQPDAVVRDDSDGRAVQAAEVLVGVRVRSAARPPDDSTFDRNPCRDATRDGGHGRGEQTGTTPVHGAAPTCSRGTRAPIRVTIS